MTGAEFKANRKALKLSQAALAGRLEIDFRTLRRWESGSWPVPAMAALAIRALFFE